MDRTFSEIVEDYADFAYNVAYRMLRNVEDAEDAVQEAFISAYRAFATFKGQSKVSTWLSDRTEFPEHEALWDGANYKTAY